MRTVSLSPAEYSELSIEGLELHRGHNVVAVAQELIEPLHPTSSSDTATPHTHATACPAQDDEADLPKFDVQSDMSTAPLERHDEDSHTSPLPSIHTSSGASLKDAPATSSPSLRYSSSSDSIEVDTESSCGSPHVPFISASLSPSEGAPQSGSTPAVRTGITRSRTSHTVRSGDSAASDVDLSDSERRRKLRKVKPGTGASRSAKASRSLRESVKNGTFELDPMQWQTYLEKLRKLDLHMEAEITQEKGCRVYHSLCSKWNVQQEPYNVANFKGHVASCRGPKALKSTKRGKLFTADPSQFGAIGAFFTAKAKDVPPGVSLPASPASDPPLQQPSTKDVQSKGPSTAAEKPRPESKATRTLTAWVERLKSTKSSIAGPQSCLESPATPTRVTQRLEDPTQADTCPVEERRVTYCGGIREAHDGVRLTKNYLKRPIDTGGGSRLESAIIKELYGDGKVKGDLTVEELEQLELQRLRAYGRTWQLDRPGARVFSTSCLQTLNHPSSTHVVGGAPPIGDECRKVLKSKSFRNALAVKPPKPEHYR